MLTHLTLINFALADHLAIDIEAGFNVLTGETGAGKSLLLDALSACLGERTDTNYVRFGTDKADVTAVFSYAAHSLEAAWLSAHELADESGEIHLRRVILPLAAVKRGSMVVPAVWPISKKLVVCWCNCIVSTVSNNCSSHLILSSGWIVTVTFSSPRNKCVTPTVHGKKISVSIKQL